MNKSTSGCEKLREAREARGLSQSDLATGVGLTRQSVNAIETGRATPGVDVALRIAAFLESSVEALFQPSTSAEDAPRLATEPSEPAPPGSRVALSQIDGRWVSYPLSRSSCAHPADGVVRRLRGRRAEVEPLTSELGAAENVVLMGCAAALGLLTERLNLQRGRGRFLWIPCSSTAALGALGKRHVHVAGVHLVDPRTGEENLPDVQRHSGHGARTVITLARWQVGIVLAKGNPHGLHTIADLLRPARRGTSPLRLVVREKGSGVRRLFERELARAGVSEAAIFEHASLARGHLEVAQAVAMGAADAGLATRDAALAYDLDFVPLFEERYDLALPKATLEDARLVRLFDTLTSAAFRRDLTALGYDARSAGDRIADVLAA